VFVGLQLFAADDNQKKVFVEKFTLEKVLPALLREEEGLGAHTSVLNLSAQVGERYTWSHPDIKPMGVALDLQCQQCGRLRSLDVSRGDENITVVCAHPECGHSFNIPSSRWKFKRAKNMHQAEWGVQKLW
jgi:acetone carboxylase gamma subunit